MEQPYQYPPGTDIATDSGRSVSVGVTATQICTKNPQRGLITLVLNLAVPVYVSKGPAPALNAGIPLLTPGAYFSCGRTSSDDKYTGELWGISAGTSQISITEQNIP
jgi:hypothetical protein